MIGGKSRSAAKLTAVRKTLKLAMAAKRKLAKKGRAGSRAATRGSPR